MSDLGDSDDLRRLAQLIEQTTGNVVPEGQYPHLERVALEHAKRAGRRGLTAYLELMEASDSEAEWRRLLPDITIKESFLFRIPEQFRALSEHVLPQLARLRPEGHRIRVWSAGCARGEEPATLAVVLAECPFLAHRDWEILATDVDEQALAAARRGVFGPRAVAQVPTLLLRTWFERRGEDYALSPDLLRRIEFRPFNFFRSPYLSLGDAFDVVFLRNVLIYFSTDSQRRVVRRVVRRLTPDGTLFLGHSESLWQVTDELEAVEFDKCFAYRRPQESGGTHEPPPRARLKAAAPRERPRPPEPPVTAPVARPPKARSSFEWRSGARSFVPSAISLVEDVNNPRPDPGSEDPSLPLEVGLSQGACALIEDRLEDARQIVDRMLAVQKSNAQAHALSGLIHDLRGSTDAAVAAYRATLFLEPGYFEIRFLLAHRFAHLNLPARARQEYRQILNDVGNGRARTLGSELQCLKRLLPTPEEAERWCRRALARA